MSVRRIPDWWSSMSSWDFWDAYDNGTWEPETHAWIDEYVTEGSTYVDIGSWIGPTVLWAAPRARRVLAVEPDPVARQMLTENVADYLNVEIVAAAVGDHTGVGELHPMPHGFGSAMSRLASDVTDRGMWKPSSETVRLFTVPDLFTEYAVENVSVVKMDIEGAEADILESVCPYLASRGVRFIVSLHHDWSSRPVLPAWFDCFSEVVGDLAAEAPVLCLP